MPLIAMNREMGSLGKDVAQGLSQALGLKVHHHEIIDHLANRARVRKSHVISFLEGTQGILERLTVDNLKLRILTADEIMSASESNEGVILRGWGATSLLKDVPHAVRVCVSASRRERVKRMMKRLDMEDQNAAERIVDQNDEAAQAVMRRHFHIDVRDINEYDVGFNTDRMTADQCVEKIMQMVRSPQFEETEQSRGKLRDVAIMHHVRAALRTHQATAHCYVKCTVQYGRITLEGVVDDSEQRNACGDIAGRIKGVMDVDNRLRTADMPTRRGGSI
ncbi:MAG TPA: cytidylate kinase family protein [Burkholderiales bacterium]|jgi:osmotically-inducible protein OsmY|nr:cytidylate kinase family protein [Burkholderiales bacterium]